MASYDELKIEYNEIKNNDLGIRKNNLDFTQVQNLISVMLATKIFAVTRDFRKLIAMVEGGLD